jgi:predicted negative regulator of RcsB-dependent stress response
MKNENNHCWILAIVIIVIVAWFFWDKFKAVVTAAAVAAKAASQEPSKTTIAPMPEKPVKRMKSFPYANGRFYFEDDTTDQLINPDFASFSTSNKSVSAFKSFN